MTKEIWRVVPSEPRFEVSNRGQVRSLDYTIHSVRDGRPYTRMHYGKLLKPVFQSGTGYYDITVESARFINGKRVPRRRSVASMVLEAFVGPRPTGHHSRHLDDNKKNNNLNNLAWGTQTDNAQDRKRNGLGYEPKGELHHNAKLTDDQVREIRKAYRRYGKEHIELAKKFGITGNMARLIGKRIRWSHVE